MDYQFRLRLNTLRIQHAIANCSQKLLHLVMRTLVIGDINNIAGCVADAMGPGCMIGFTNSEQDLLNVGDHQSWDMCFLYKTIKVVCGLQPPEHYYWMQATDGDGPLESLIHMLMEMRREMAHEDLIIQEDELTEHLNRLTQLAIWVTNSLREHAQGHGIEVLDIEETMDIVSNIIEEVQGEINEGDDEDQEDDYEPQVLEADGIHGGAVAEGPLHEDIIQSLTRRFWELAGRMEGA